MPAVSICTDAFVVPAQAMAKAYGFGGFEFVTVPHPVASLDETQIQVLARDLMPGLLRILGLDTPGLEY